MDNVYNTAPAAKKLVLKEERQKIPHCTQRTQNHLSEDGVLIFTRQRVFKPNSQKKKFPLPNEGKIGRTWDLTQATVITPCNKATSLPLQRKQTQLFLQRWWREASRGGNLAAGDTRPWPARSRRNTWPSCHTQPPPGRRWRRIPCNREQGLLHTLSLSCGPHPAACASLLRFDRSLRLLAHPLPQTPATRGPFKAWSRSPFGFAPSAYSKPVILTLHSHFSFILFKIPFNIKVTGVTTMSQISTCDWVNCFACVFQCWDLLEVCFFWCKLGRH